MWSIPQVLEVEMKVKIEFKPQDLWIGIYWTTREEVYFNLNHDIVVIHILVCIIPMLPIHITYRRK